ncbi:glycosyl transferase [Bacillus cereus]|nr:glycosyl transferase [Bacillus cereus]
MMENKLIGNMKISITDEIEVINYLDKRIEDREKTKVFFLNAHCFNIAQKNLTYKTNMNDAELVLNDGIGVDIGAKVFGFKFKKNMNGTDFTPKLLSHAEKKGHTVYLLGGKPGIAEEAKNNFLQQFKELNIVGVHDGYFFKNEANVIEDINQKRPDILIIGFGVPLQENWISEHSEELDVNILIGVGAFLDFSSKKVKRAPKWMQVCRLEWLFRLLIEPKRMFRRYVLGIPLFFFYIIKNRI